MTTQHTENEHNEEHGAHAVDESVVASQHTPDTSVADDVPSSSDETPSVTHMSTNTDTSSEVGDMPSEHSSSLEETRSITTASFAEETGNTIPELASVINAEDIQVPAQQEEMSTHATQDAVSTTSAEDTQTPAQQELAPAATTENAQEQRTIANQVTDEQHQSVASAERNEPVEELIAPDAQAEQVTPETVDAVAAPVFLVESETVATEIMPEASEEAVRPFTAFIEEFHQAQAEAEAQAEADLTASLQGVQQGTQAEAFSEFANPEMVATAVDSPISLEEALPPVDFGEGSAFIPTSDETATVNVAEINTPALAEAAVDEANQRVAAVEETSGEQVAAPAVQPVERPVSPLLRPALRPRPRHGVTRHRDEVTAPAANPTLTESSTPSGGTATTTQATQEVMTTSEPPKETAKPPRRYRFDRPAPQVAQTTQTQVTSPVSKPATSVAANTNNGGALTPPPASLPTPTFARVEENAAPKSASVSTPTTSVTEQTSGESASTESTSIVSPPVEQVRRRNGAERHARQEREKEQNVLPPVVAPPSVADIAAALVSETKAEEVAPEDLPPLEYAELQKANSSRRRRRHRAPTPVATPVAKESTTSTNGTQAGTPLTPASPITPPAPLAPASPITSALQNGASGKPAVPSTATAASYAITSGYTVGQMNQGNEESGPFMGPEPSPARGSVNTTRDGRTVRVESQPQRSAPYQTRAAEGMLPVAAMNHFANIVSQAIQTQSDRMVTELRRANQSPTNVSVSLPPFPSTERVGVFVDVANLLYSARTQRIAIDFGKLLDFLRGNRRLIRAHAYCPTSPQPGDEQMFLTAVKGLGYRITTKNYKTFASGAKKADLDLDLCMDVVRIVDGKAVDAIVLVSGDSDFMPMLDYCSDHGVRVEVAAFDEAMSATLRQSCDLFINLSMLEEIRA